MSENNYFSVDYLSGRYNNHKLVISAHGIMAKALMGVSGWSEGNDDSCNVILETMPTTQWIKDTSSAIYGCAKSIEPTDKNKAVQALNEWKNIISDNLRLLPRVILIREEETPEIGQRRRKRYLWAACGYGDLKMREILKSLDFTWDRVKYAYVKYDFPKQLDGIEMILSEWNEPHKKLLIEADSMYKYFPKLKREQIESIKFLLERWNMGWHGALDADDMGIGKTLTALVFGRMSVDAGFANKIVVVANKQTVKGWVDEWNDKMKGQGPAFAYTSETLGKARYADKPGKNNGHDNLIEDMENSELIVTNYEYITDPTRLADLLPMCRKSIAVFDEATKCSNPTTDNTKSAAQVSLASAFSVGLTGTPLSKNIYEAWSIFRLLDPGIYPSEEFYPIHLVEKEKKIWLPKYKTAKIIKIPEYHYPEIFHKRVDEHFIRHEKNVAVMEAEKVEKRYKIAPIDSKLENQVAWQIFNRVGNVYHKDIDWEKFGEDNISVPRWQLTAMAHIQAALDDPYILFGSSVYLKYRGEVEAQKANGLSEAKAKKKVLSQTSDDRFGRTVDIYGDEQKVVFEYLDATNKNEWEDYIPAKIVLLTRLLKEQWNDKKVVVFCSFSRTCDRAAELLGEIFPDRTITQIKGSMSMTARENSVEALRQSENGIMVCTDAMAFGANLQFADALVHYNIPWSSAVWKQRTDRIFRTGSVGRKDIAYLTLDHPLEKRKITLMAKNLKTIRDAMGIDMSEMPDEEFINFDFERDISHARLLPDGSHRHHAEEPEKKIEDDDYAVFAEAMPSRE